MPPRHFQRAVVLFAAALAGATAVHADVLEVAPDGTVFTRAGSGVARWTGAPADDATADDADDADAPPDDEPVVQPAILTLVGPPEVPPVYAAALVRAAVAADISPDLLAALVWRESRWRPQAVSPAGAIGLTQLMPATARRLGVDPRDPVANLAGGARYLRQQLDLFDGDIERALAAYNAGPGRVLKADGVPPIAETRAYVGTIVAHLTLTGATR